VKRDRLALVGWGLCLLAVPIVCDVVAIARGDETLSRLYARAALHPVAGPFVVGASAGLLYHLGQTVADEWVRSQRSR
jgi:hypothetical protein